VRQVALPYRTASLSCWDLGPWRRLDGDPDAELPDRIDDWDYSVPLALACDVVVDVTRLREEVGLPSDDALTLVALWEATSTGIREVGSRQPVLGASEQAFELFLRLDGSRIGGQLILERLVVLSSPGTSDDALAARTAGSVLLAEPRADRSTIVLEGEAARFPTEVLDFGELPIAEPEALWFLDLDFADLEQSPLSAMRLYVNGVHPAMERALVQGDDVGALVRSTLQWDVARILIHRALDHDEFVAEWDGFGEDTLGLALQQLIQRLWPGEDASSLRARRLAKPARFEYQLQARLNLLSRVA
jgi:hypothetical protein